MPVLKQIDSTKSFLTRAEKRYSQIEEQITELIKEKVGMEKEIAVVQDRLRAMERETATLLNCTPPPAQSQQVEALAEAVRTLMVVMHKHDLPPQVAEAVTVVTQHLPEEPFSEDYVEEVPIETRPRGVTRPLAPDADTDASMQEWDDIEEEDDVALLAMARRLKRARQTAPFWWIHISRSGI